MTKDTATHDAWIIGTHDTSDAPEHVLTLADAVEHNTIIVLDRETDEVVIMTDEDFDAEYEWIEE